MSLHFFLKVFDNFDTFHNNSYFCKNRRIWKNKIAELNKPHKRSCPAKKDKWSISTSYSFHTKNLWSVHFPLFSLMACCRFVEPCGCYIWKTVVFETVIFIPIRVLVPWCSVLLLSIRSAMFAISCCCRPSTYSTTLSLPFLPVRHQFQEPRSGRTASLNSSAWISPPLNLKARHTCTLWHNVFHPLLPLSISIYPSPTFSCFPFYFCIKLYSSSPPSPMLLSSSTHIVATVLVVVCKMIRTAGYRGQYNPPPAARHRTSSGNSEGDK